MKTIRGDLITLALSGQFDIIVHGCNCFCTMGAGIAAKIAMTWPDARKADEATCYGDLGKLGSFTYASVEQDTNAGLHNLTIVNAYTQYRYGSGGPHIDYTAFDRCLEGLCGFVDHLLRTTPVDRIRIGMPRIGSGLAGGDSIKIEEIIRKYDNLLDITIVDLA